MNNKLKPSWFDIISGKSNRYDDVIKLREQIQFIVDAWENSPILERLNGCIPNTPPKELTYSMMFNFNEVGYCKYFGQDEVVKELRKRRDVILLELSDYVLTPYIEEKVGLIKSIIREEKINSVMSV
jgi:hypothetical protein